MSLKKEKQPDATSDQQKKHIQRPIMGIVLFTTKFGSLVNIIHKGQTII